MEESVPIQDVPIKGTIKTILQFIENITTKEIIDISFVIIHNDVVLGESIPIAIDHNPDELLQIYEINFAVELPIIINDRSSMDSIVSTPILIKVMCNKNQRLSNSARSTTESKKRTRLSNQNQLSSSSNVIGFCNLDLIPILLGEKSFTEKLTVEIDYLSFDDNETSWQNYPILTVTVICDDEKIFPLEAEINFLTITVESIYNPPKSFIEDAEYKAGTIAFIDDKITDKIIFEDGKWTRYHDVERTKRWQSLSKLDSRAKSTKYKLRYDYTNINNTLTQKLDLERKVWTDEPRIEWNLMSRKMLYDAGVKMMQKHIAKYKYWPFLFMVEEKLLEKNKVKFKEHIPTKCQIYQCYLDLSELLSPERKTSRVMAQLYTYNRSDMVEKTGLDIDIFNVDLRNNSLNEQDRNIQIFESISSDTVIMPSNALISESGEPVFIVIEVELYYPLIPYRLETDLSGLIDKMITPKVIKPYYVYSGDLAEEHYATCIRKLVEIITENYRDFRDDSREEKSLIPEQVEKRRYCFSPETDELACFTQYLHKTGMYSAIRSTLKAKVITLLDQKFKTDIRDTSIDSIDNQNFIASVYTYLVERMHLAINKIVESRLTDDSPKIKVPEKLYLYAEEAYELGHIDSARRHYQTAIASNEYDPEAWTQYAIFLLKIGDIDRAEECCHEAILLNRRDKIALLIYGLILAKNRKYGEAEIFFQSVTEFYPWFVEGWVILHLFYICTEYYLGIDLTLETAEKCLKDTDRKTEVPIKESLAWTMVHCPWNSVYMRTVTFLMKLHCCDLAGKALMQEMSRMGRCTHVLYYLAVQQYLLHRYEDALSYLREAECIYGKDYSISSLMGHCYFQENNFDEAIRCYEFAMMQFNRPNNTHLVQMRMGLYYEDIGDYERAIKIFLRVSSILPTAETWLGVGISFYELQRFTEAEAALTEANQIDNRNVNVWKYLCLLNLSFERHDEFAQCYRQIAQDRTAFSLEKRSLKPRERKASESVML